MKLSTIIRSVWKPKGEGRRPVGLLLHAAGGALVVGIPFYFTEFSLAFGAALVGLSAGLGVWKEIGEWKLFGTPPNLLDVVPWPIGALLALLLIGLGEGW